MLWQRQRQLELRKPMHLIELSTCSVVTHVTVPAKCDKEVRSSIQNSIRMCVRLQSRKFIPVYIYMLHPPCYKYMVLYITNTYIVCAF